MISADDFSILFLAAINQSRKLWPDSWREPPHKIGSLWVHANVGAEDMLSGDLWWKYCQCHESVRHVGGWMWSEVTAALNRLARMERNGGLIGRKEKTSRAVKSWDSSQGWDGPTGDSGLPMGYGEGGAPSVSLTNFSAAYDALVNDPDAWDAWNQEIDTAETETESADPARILQRIVKLTELQDIAGRLQCVRRLPCRSERFKRPWVNPANPGLTDAQLRVKYPRGYAAMLRNPYRYPTAVPLANFYGPANWPSQQDKKTLFKGMAGSATAAHALVASSPEDKPVRVVAWLNGKRYYGHRRRYDWQMEAYRTPWLCMLRETVPGTYLPDQREALRREGAEKARQWLLAVEADKIRWRGYDFPTSRSK